MISCLNFDVLYLLLGHALDSHQNSYVNPKKAHQKAQNLSSKIDTQNDRLERTKARLQRKLEERQGGVRVADPEINLVAVVILLNALPA